MQKDPNLDMAIDIMKAIERARTYTLDALQRERLKVQINSGAIRWN